MIKLEDVMSQVCYDRDTGLFTYLKSAGCRKSGDIVGWSDASNGVKYKITKINKVKVRLHRLAFFYVTGRWPIQIDHINGDGSDNRWENLREVSGNENNKNTKILKNNKSGVHGVSWYKGKKWASKITVMKKQIHLGYYHDFFEAVCSRKSAEVLHGFHINHGSR
tara:strand:- start:1490 stop:1984 length:495 start_codon:yes stop_codon:yes gene_type:complete